jgi:predicted DNA-binding transcriptional regulator YafY
MFYLFFAIMITACCNSRILLMATNFISMQTQIITDIKFDLLQRYRLIEIVALWEGKLNAGHLTKYFGIGRQQASKDINEYCNRIAPENLSYNRSLKGYEPTEKFVPVVTVGNADEYLQLISRNNDLLNTFSDLSLGFDASYQLIAPTFKVEPKVLRAIVNACKRNMRLEVDYRSVNAPNEDGRIIIPHSIVHAGARWHVRAFCEKNQDFRDFVLTRFYDEPEAVGESKVSPDLDTKWHTMVNVCFMPDSRLSEAQQQIVSQDYGMADKRLLISTRGALVPYLMQLMRVDVNTIAADPRAQQVVIENMDAIKQWMFQ